MCWFYFRESKCLKRKKCFGRQTNFLGPRRPSFLVLWLVPEITHILTREILCRLVHCFSSFLLPGENTYSVFVTLNFLLNSTACFSRTLPFQTKGPPFYQGSLQLQWSNLFIFIPRLKVEGKGIAISQSVAVVYAPRVFGFICLLIRLSNLSFKRSSKKCICGQKWIFYQ